MSFNPPAFADMKRVYRCWHCQRSIVYTLHELFSHLAMFHHMPFPGQPYEIDEEP